MNIDSPENHRIITDAAQLAHHLFFEGSWRWRDADSAGYHVPSPAEIALKLRELLETSALRGHSEVSGGRFLVMPGPLDKPGALSLYINLGSVWIGEDNGNG